MKKNRSVMFWYFALVLFLCSLFIMPVGASAARMSTATWDIRTPPPTPIGTPDIGELFPTITATANMACPVGTPIGYGTLTPGLNWLLTCGECLPAGTSTPTFDFNQVVATNGIDTNTPVPGTSTPTRTITPTSTVSPTPNGLAFTVISVATGYAGTGVQAGSVNISWSCTPAQGGQGNIVDCTGSGGLYDERNNYGTNWYTTVTLDPIAGGTFTWYWDMLGTQTAGDGGVSYKRQGGTISSTGSVSLGSSTNPIFQVQFDTTTGYVGYNNGTVRIRVSTSPLPAFTPTPTVTPTSTYSYCQVIDDDDYDYEEWFDLIGLTGSQYCLVTPYISAADFFGSGWTAFFSFLFPAEVVDWIAQAVIPAQTWCFYGFGFVPIQLFSIQVDPTIFADIAIVLFIVVHFLNK